MRQKTLMSIRDVSRETEPDFDTLIYGEWLEKVHDHVVHDIVSRVREHNFIYHSQLVYMRKAFLEWRMRKMSQIKKSVYYKNVLAKHKPIKIKGNDFDKKRTLTHIIKARKYTSKYDPNIVYGL